ncbi:hypothetical protein MP638_003574 [Amoeboaphelidium occidentale]|nr:hypothetical protein MP638_003574 [Amoeboaphelidium occidentale]
MLRIIQKRNFSLPSPSEALKSHLSKTPQVSRCAYVAKNASVIGNVLCGNNSSIWFQAVLRGDINQIKVGDNSNIQDGVVVHVTRKYRTDIGDGVSVGHNAVLHGCKIGHDCLIGMGAILLDGCSIGNECLVAAGSVVPPGKVFEDGNLIMGSPAVAKRKLKLEELYEIKENATRYVEYAKNYNR